jgi:hypothetical protein
MPTLITAFCTRNWADTFFSQYGFDAAWADASDEKKASALAAATDFIELYCVFYDADENVFEYEKAESDDFDDAINPRKIKQACAQEAAYLLSLDDNPAEPHPLTVLGLLRTDSMTIAEDLVPPIFSQIVVRLLTKLGGEVDSEAVKSDGISIFEKNVT